jgi:hypothetical protein
MKMGLGDEFKEMFRVLKAGKPYFLSHHPLCDRYKKDCYTIGSKRLCIGCFTSYPIAIVIVLLWYFDMIDMPYLLLFLIGFLAGMVQFLSIFPFSENRKIKIAIKVSLGIGMGLFTAGIFSLPIPSLLRIVLFILCIQISGLFSFLRMRKIKEKCRRCEYRGDWGTCPGFPIETEGIDLNW